jgi:hypothetical protein
MVSRTLLRGSLRIFSRNRQDTGGREMTLEQIDKQQRMSERSYRNHPHHSRWLTAFHGEEARIRDACLWGTFLNAVCKVEEAMDDAE